MSALIIIKALEDGVSVLFSSGEDIDPPSPVRLDCGEVLIITAPEKRDGVQIRGHAEVYTSDHVVSAESGLVIGGRTEDSQKPGQ